jgi:HTH-type transcriptional regulator/antitoxin HigA
MASPVISNIINAKRALSPDVASNLAAAFGTTAQFWMNLETSYQLFSESHADGDIQRKAKLFSRAPVKDMIKRGWIEPSRDIAVLETRVREFLEIDSLDEECRLVYAAKKSTSVANSSQVAWVYRAKKIARGIHAAKFASKSFAATLATLKGLRANPEDVRHVPRVLAEGGVRLVLIEGLSKGRIDGATLWLDDVSPVIVLSMRYDRIDHFWFALLHESGHVHNGDARDGKPVLDVDLVGDHAVPFEEKTEIEKRADLFAEKFLVEKNEMENFISRYRPLYSKQKIKNFAARIGVHPAIVLGQLQHRKEVDWTHSREMLVKVRDTLISSALTDGWGHNLPSDI